MEHAAQMMECISKLMAVVTSMMDRPKDASSTERMWLIQRSIQSHSVGNSIAFRSLII